MVVERMMELAKELFPICRSITGHGVRDTLKIIQREIPITIHAVPSGTKAFDWTVPDEWNIRDAYIESRPGNRIIDFKNNNLHIVGYSEPISKWVSREILLEHVHSGIGCIPYVTSYYNRNWGFCCTEETERDLVHDEYFVHIDSDLKPGNLNYGELIIPGWERTEILLSTYICHPSMANDNVSGMVVVAELAKWIMRRPRRHTYRFVFVPETIGSIVYISQRDLSNVIAGYVISRVGNDLPIWVTCSRSGKTLADRATALWHGNSFLLRASDERQYGSPLVDLPVCAISRGDFHEYHTSLDNLNLLSESNLLGAISFAQMTINILEANRVYRPTTKCEPQMGARYPAVGSKPHDLMNILAYADGRDLIDMAATLQIEVVHLAKLCSQLERGGLLALA